MDPFSIIEREGRERGKEGGGQGGRGRPLWFWRETYGGPFPPTGEDLMGPSLDVRPEDVRPVHVGPEGDGGVSRGTCRAPVGAQTRDESPEPRATTPDREGHRGLMDTSPVRHRYGPRPWVGWKDRNHLCKTKHEKNVRPLFVMVGRTRDTQSTPVYKRLPLLYIEVPCLILHNKPGDLVP